MQTFLPYPDFRQCAKVLDDRRLGKQRVEAKQILDCLTGKGSLAWQNHPAVKMWRGYTAALRCYIDCMLLEWEIRGFKNEKMKFTMRYDFWRKPEWLGNEKLHLSHQSNLVRKLPSHYRKYFPNVPSNLPYYWPIRARRLIHGNTTAYSRRRGKAIRNRSLHENVA